MKTLLRAIPLWLILGGLTVLLMMVTDGVTSRPLTILLLPFLLPLAAWLTARAAAALPERMLMRIGFWAVTSAGWFTVLTFVQGRTEEFRDERASAVVALTLAAAIAAWAGWKSRTALPWARLAREIPAGFAIFTLVCGICYACYESGTRALSARAVARWKEIGLPMTEFEKTLQPSVENRGSEIVRQVLRQEVSAQFYRPGTEAAKREPAIPFSEAGKQLSKEAKEIVKAARHPADEIAALPPKAMAALESHVPALDADYERILAAEPAAWAANPKDGFFMSIPNYLGIQEFSEVAAADAVRRIAAGDQEGAARAIAAGLRLREGLRSHPSVMSLGMNIGTDALLAPRQVWLPPSNGGFESISRDLAEFRALLLSRIQMEAWICLNADVEIVNGAPGFGFLPGWAGRFVVRPWYRRVDALAALKYAEHAVIQMSPKTLSLPDFGEGQAEALMDSHPCIQEMNFVRLSMRLHVVLLLREQTEIIREARARLAAGQPVESRDSVVLPGIRWEVVADKEKGTVTTRMTGAPKWIANQSMTGDEFWLLPIDGSVAWQFRLPLRGALGSL